MNGLITFGYIVLAIVILLIMVLIHEVGHYLAGIALKFKITEFSVGLGPVVAIPKFWDKTAMARIRARRIESKQEDYRPEPTSLINRDYLFRLQRQNKRGENISLRWFPLGGFCSFAGEQRSDGTPVQGGYYAQRPWKRLIVQAAGAVFNIISAFFFCMILIGVVGYSVPKVEAIHFDPTELNAGGYENLLQVGDEIVAVGGKRVTVLNPYVELMTYEKDEEYVLTVRRTTDGETREETVKGKILEYRYTDAEGNEKEAVGMGVTVKYLQQHHSAGQSIGYAFPYAFKMAGQVLSIFGQMLTGQIALSSLGGPVSTVVVIGEYASQSASYLLLLLPLIAVNLGVFNLLPIPSLDGAHIVFTLIEMIFRKPVPRKIEGYIHSVGLVVLLGFVILIDLLHFLT